MRRDLARRNISLILTFVCQQNRTVAGREKGCFLARRGDCNTSGVGPKCAVVELRKLANATANVRSDGQGPQHAALAKLNILAAPDGLEVLDVLLRSPCKEKQFVKVTLPRQLRFTGRQIRVLGQLARRERAQRHN